MPAHPPTPMTKVVTMNKPCDVGRPTGNVGLKVGRSQLRLTRVSGQAGELSVSPERSGRLRG